MKEWFHAVASRVAFIAGSPGAFILCLSIVLAWAISGPLFNFSDSWQLVINTGTTIVTFLMVFLIQNTQNRDAKAVHLKLDELIRATRTARDSFIDLEDMNDEELSILEGEFRDLHEAQNSKVATRFQERIKAVRTRRRRN